MKTFVPWLAAMVLSGPAAAQDLNLSGGWICENNCMCGMHPGPGAPASIAQDGATFVFTNECGTVGHGSSASKNSIKIDDWSTTVVASPDQRTLKFDNGAIWKRPSP